MPKSEIRASDLIAILIFQKPRTTTLIYPCKCGCRFKIRDLRHGAWTMCPECGQRFVIERKDTMIKVWRADYERDTITPVEFDQEQALYYVNARGQVFPKRAEFYALCSAWDEALECLKARVRRDIRNTQLDLEHEEARLARLNQIQKPEDGS